MRYIEETYEEKGLHIAAVVYSIVLLAAFFIGLYGLMSLLWLATSEAERSLQVVSSLL